VTIKQTIQAPATVAPIPVAKTDANILPIPGLPEGFFDDPVKDAKARNIVLSGYLYFELRMSFCHSNGKLLSHSSRHQITGQLLLFSFQMRLTRNSKNLKEKCKWKS
jgi:hypothetical protein